MSPSEPQFSKDMQDAIRAICREEIALDKRTTAAATPPPKAVKQQAIPEAPKKAVKKKRGIFG